MKKIIGLGAILLALIFIGGCQKPIYNVQNTISAKDKSIEDIYNAIKKGAENATWTVERISDNEVIATTHIRVHTAKVKITFDETSYSIKLFRAINIDYEPEKGTIHENYNKWVQLLETEIDEQLSITKKVN